MKLFLDDLRDVPDGYTIARTYEDCIDILSKNQVEQLSLDHDLGTKKTGYDVCLWLVENEVYPDVIMIHSANPVGQKNMIQLLNRYMPETTKLYTKLGSDFIRVFRS